MIMTMVVIKKYTHYMSIAAKTMTKFKKKNKFKKTILLLFQDAEKCKSLIFAFPLKMEVFSLFCLLNLSV